MAQRALTGCVTTLRLGSLRPLRHARAAPRRLVTMAAPAELRFISGAPPGSSGSAARRIDAADEHEALAAIVASLAAAER